MYMLRTLTTSRHQTNLQILDNEVSSSLRQILLKNKSSTRCYPHTYIDKNASKRAIQTFKAYLITYLCASNPKYPSKEWDILPLQETLTLNLLHNCRFNTKLSAHAALHGTFYYKKTLLAPLGTIVLVYEKKTNHRTWKPHGTNGWYIGPALEHYLCMECYIPSTHSTIISDKVELISAFIPIPKTILEDYFHKPIPYIICLLAYPNLTVISL